MDMSIRDTVFDDTPIFITRPVDETGGMITGGAAQVGIVVRTVVKRSWTSCRARTRSVPGLNSSSIDDRSGIDLERMRSSPSTPLNACSSGTVTRPSTSSAVMPRDGVWISTRGGANSGKASTETLECCVIPYAIIAVASARTMNRNLRLAPTINRIMGRVSGAGLLFLELFFGAEQLCRTDRHHRGAKPRRHRENREVPVDVVDRDRSPNERERLSARVHPGVAFLVIQDRCVGHDRAERPLHLHGPHRSGLDVEPLGCLRRQNHPLELASVDRLYLDSAASRFLGFGSPWRTPSKRKTRDQQARHHRQLFVAHRSPWSDWVIDAPCDE